MTIMNNRYKLLLFIGIILNLNVLKSQSTWEVPEDKKQKVSSFKFDNESKTKGESLFQKNCVSCHGTPGKNNSVALVPPPGDPATDKFQKQTDGALFFKMTSGRAVMPSFKDVLTENERWQVISYIRSFNSSYVQAEPVKAVKGAFAGLDIFLKVDYIENQNIIKVKAIGIKNNESKPLEGIELKLFAKRYFGNIQIDEPKITNSLGETSFDYAKKVQGDSIGNVQFLVKATTEGLDGIKTDTLLKAGNAVITKSLIDTRAMWTTRSNAPIWLILAYSVIVLTVWSVLIYIIMQIFKIGKLGKAVKEN